jgi:anti-sigma regulatory factor (Ser/Thr protein kinase)
MDSSEGLQPDKRSISSEEPAMAKLGERDFPPDTASVSEARRFAREVLGSRPLHLVQDVQLIVSELATNCVLYAKTWFTLRISASADRVRLEVGDSSPGLPVLLRPSDEQVSGRGLMITDALSTAWGVEHRGRSEKVVWCSVLARDGHLLATA